MTMARYRTIKPQFFDDIKVRRLSRDARLLYVGLWVFADDLGVVIGDTVWLKSKVFPYDQIQIQQFERWLNELVINGFICLLTYNHSFTNMRCTLSAKKNRPPTFHGL